MGCRSSKPEYRVAFIQIRVLTDLMRSHSLTPDSLSPSDAQLQLPNVLPTQTGWTLLHIACWYGLADAVQVLLNSGHNPSAKDHRGREARELALRGDYEDCVKLLSDDMSRSLFYLRQKQALDDTAPSTEMTSRSLYAGGKTTKPVICFDD